MEWIEMSERELRRVEVLLQVICGSLSQEQAVVRLSLRARQIRRLLR